MMRIKDIPELAGRLKYIRTQLGLSQIELAGIAGTTQQAIQQAETGKARNPRYLHKIALALDVPYEWLTMNVMPVTTEKKSGIKGFAEKDREILTHYFAMPKKDQSLILELMKARNNEKKTRDT